MPARKQITGKPAHMKCNICNYNKKECQDAGYCAYGVQAKVNIQKQIANSATACCW